MAQQNFLLGKGERLTTDNVVKRGGQPKEEPYTIAEARDRLAPMVAGAAAAIDDLPEAACPKDEAVISLTLNPQYIAKSYFPGNLLGDVGIEVVGSRPRQITPEKRSRGRDPEAAFATELFGRGKRSSIRDWGRNLPSWSTGHPVAKNLPSIETILAPAPEDKIKGQLPSSGDIVLEIVLHASEMESWLTQGFAVYLDWLEIDAKFGRKFFAKGLCFRRLTRPRNGRARSQPLPVSVRCVRCPGSGRCGHWFAHPRFRTRKSICRTIHQYRAMSGSR
ncbi:MAG: hypothetical protein OXD36_06690 [Rhodobacter sp.]|nr:hypothetical protein [Rhodobacter sp.]MCY4241412.1 hypothetical protein [Rhodobacter sp.]